MRFVSKCHNLLKTGENVLTIKKLLPVGILLAAAPLALAETDGNELGWSGNTELGFKSTSGNTDDKNMTFRQKVVYQAKVWSNTLTLAADNSLADGDRTQEKYFLADEFNRDFTERSFGFVRGSYLKDRFDGYDYQATTSVGYGYRFINTDKFLLIGKAGIGGTFQKETQTGDTLQAVLYTVGDDFVWHISKSVEFGQAALIEYSTINTITTASVYIQSQVISNIAMRFSYSVRHNDKPPVDTESTDTEFLATLVYSF